MVDGENRDGGLERWVPGLRAARGYERAWLRRDVVAGVVLAAILVPQGMAYAELAGLPAVTGLYTTIACLVGYAVFGPSRVLVLGPDSSISPLILAAITPLLAGGDAGTAIALAGMLAVLVGIIEIGLGLGKLGLRRGPALQGGAGRLHERPRRHDHRRPAAEAVRVLDRRGLVPRRRSKAFFDGLDETQRRDAGRGLGRARRAARAAAGLAPACPRCSSRWSARPSPRRSSDLADHGVATVGSLPQRRARRRPSRGRSASDVPPLLIAAIGITLVSLTDTIATATSFAARRGDEVEPDQEMIGMGAANIAAGFFQGFAVSTSGSRTAVAEQSGAKTQLTGVVGAGLVVVLLLFFNSLLADLPQAALAAVVIAAALSLMDVPLLRRYLAVRPSAFCVSLVATRGGDPARRAAGHRGRGRAGDPAVLPAQLVAARRGARRASTSSEGWHSVDDATPTPSSSRASSSTAGRRRCSSPTPANSASRSAGSSASASPRGSSCSARRSPTSTSRRRRCSSSSTTSSTPPASTSRSPSCAAASRSSILRYGLMDTLDRDHFYPTLEAALEAIEGSAAAGPEA